MRVVLVGVLLLFGCGARPEAAVTAAPTPVAEATAGQAIPAPAPIPARRISKMPAPTRMADGGILIDLRGTARHVRTLERGTDGKFHQACVDAPAVLGGQGTP